MVALGWWRAAAVSGVAAWLAVAGCSNSEGHTPGTGAPSPPPDAAPIADAPVTHPDAPPPHDSGATDAASDGTSRVDAGPPRRVLFVGNSYTAANDLPGVIRALGAATPGGAVEVEAIVPGGMLLEAHWSTPETRARMESGEFAVVVLQAQSVEPIVSENFHYFTPDLSKAVRNAGALPVWFATWARREGNELYAQFPAVYQDPAYMTRSLEFHYLAAARANDDAVARAGAAWEIARTELPDITLYAEDGSHPSAEGTLLTACVLFPWITGKTATIPEPPPLGVPRATAEKLCALAPRVRCEETKKLCAGACVNTQTDTAHCGDCDEPCSEDDPCREGVCGCDPGFTGCSRSCVNLQTDPRYCGDCNTKCATGEICVAGKCACPAAHLMEPTKEALAALQPTCATHDDLGKVACGLAGHALCRELGCFTSGFGPASGHSAKRDGSVVCVPGDVRETTYTALKGFEPACEGPAETLVPPCVTAMHRYCVSIGAMSGYGPVAQDGDAVSVTCLTKATVVQTTLEVLRKQASRCTTDPVTCTTASSTFCASAGHLAGFGPVEVSGDTATVICVDP